MPRENNSERTTKKKSTVNKAGNYTKPTMRKGFSRRIKAGSRGGKPRSMVSSESPALANEYKKAGGGYK